MSVTKPTCNELPDVPPTLTVQFPLGITFQSMPIGKDPISTQLNALQSIFAQLAPALAGIYPVFVVIDTVVAIKDTLAAVPGVVFGDLQSFSDALQRVLDGVSKLTGAVPSLAVPLMIKSVVDLIRVGIGTLNEVLDEIAGTEQDAADALAAAQTLPAAYKADAIATGKCLQKEAQKRLAHALDAIGPVAQILNVMNLLGSLASVPGLPSLGDLSGKTTQEVKDALNVLDEALQALPL